jgi:hypothetical protein
MSNKDLHDASVEAVDALFYAVAKENVLIDELFRAAAKEISGKENVSIEEALEGAWLLFELGLLRLARDDNTERPLGVEVCGANRAERQAVAKQNRCLVEFRRRQMVRAAA